MAQLTYRGVVYPWQCDHMGHMNVAFYVSKFDEATWQFFRLCGITGRYLRNNNAAMAGVHQEIDYKRELLPGDTIRIESWITEAGARKLSSVHEMYDDVTNDVVAVCALTAVHIDALTRKARDFPPDIRATMSEIVA